MTGHIFAEGSQIPQTERAFHFISIKVKGKRGKTGNYKAAGQNLNSASQALHNKVV